MQRRTLLCSLPFWGGLAAPARAHHGWSSFDESRPLYLSGTVKAVKWHNPHAEIIITADATGLPPGLANLPVPPQTQSVNGARILASARLPRRSGDWTLELSPMTRIEAWQIPQPKPGDTLAAVGYSYKDEQGPAFARVEYLIIGSRLYGLRSMPA